MMNIHFIKPRIDVEYDLEIFEDLDQPIIDERFTSAVVANISSIEVLRAAWLAVKGGISPGEVQLARAVDISEVKLPKGFVYTEDLTIPCETIVMPIHATTIMFLIQQRSGMFACAGIITSEFEQIRHDKPAQLVLPTVLAPSH